MTYVISAVIVVLAVSCVAADLGGFKLGGYGDLQKILEVPVGFKPVDLDRTATSDVTVVRPTIDETDGDTIMPAEAPSSTPGPVPAADDDDDDADDGDAGGDGEDERTGRKLQKICGRDRLRRGEGRGDCRFQMVWRDGSSVSCTAFQYSPNKFITAAHCFDHDAFYPDPTQDDIVIQCGYPLDGFLPGGLPRDEDHIFLDIDETLPPDLVNQIPVNGYAMPSAYRVFSDLGLHEVAGRYDVAMINLQESIIFPNAVPDVTAAYRIAPFPVDRETGEVLSFRSGLDVVGFPDGSPSAPVCLAEGYNSELKYESSGDIVGVNATDAWHDMPTCPGMSGAGIWQLDAIRAVHVGSTFGDFGDSCYNRMVIFNANKGHGFANGFQQGVYLPDLVDYLGRTKYDNTQAF